MFKFFRADAGSQYPQDFFYDQQQPQQAQVGPNYSDFGQDPREVNTLIQNLFKRKINNESTYFAK